MMLQTFEEFQTKKLHTTWNFSLLTPKLLLRFTSLMQNPVLSFYGLSENFVLLTYYFLPRLNSRPSLILIFFKFYLHFICTAF